MKMYDLRSLEKGFIARIKDDKNLKGQLKEAIEKALKSEKIMSDSRLYVEETFRDSTDREYEIGCIASKMLKSLS